MITPSSSSTSSPATASQQFQYHFSPPAYQPMIEPSALLLNDEVFDHPHRQHHMHAQAESRQMNFVRRNNLPRLRSSRMPHSGTPVLPAATVVVRTQLRSQVQTKILAIIYNPESTKFKTITHTKYFSTRITMTRTAAQQLKSLLREAYQQANSLLHYPYFVWPWTSPMSAILVL